MLFRSLRLLFADVASDFVATEHLGGDLDVVSLHSGRIRISMNSAAAGYYTADPSTTVEIATGLVVAYSPIIACERPDFEVFAEVREGFPEGFGLGPFVPGHPWTDESHFPEDDHVHVGTRPPIHPGAAPPAPHARHNRFDVPLDLDSWPGLIDTDPIPEFAPVLLRRPRVDRALA